VRQDWFAARLGPCHLRGVFAAPLAGRWLFAARGKPRGEPAAGSERIVLGRPCAYNQVVSENLPSNFP